MTTTTSRPGLPAATKSTRLWIIRWQDSLSSLLRWRLLASILLFYIPALASGLLLEWVLKERFITRGVHIALAWLALGPFILREAFRVMSSFLDRHKDIFPSEAEWREFAETEMAKLHSARYLVFGIPWTIAVVAVLLLSLFPTASIPAKAWAATVMSILFLLCSIGFHGIHVMITMIPRICSAGIRFQPYHPDRFGGMAAFGTFALKLAVMFSSGCLFFPLVFEALQRSSGAANLIGLAVYVLAGAFVCTMIAAFVLPVLAIKRFADREKERILIACRAELDRLAAKFNEGDSLDLKALLQIAIHYHLNYAKLQQLKTYPYDYRTVLQFLFATILPVGMVILERFVR